ncbi:MAG: aminomethyl-transferring glycine dehydrogenase [Ilumatobacteraceae bacterium]
MSTVPIVPAATDFSDRHIGPTAFDVERMLEVIGVSSVGELIDQTVPVDIRDDRDLDLPDALDEASAIAELREIAMTNRRLTSLIGMGYTGTIMPSVIRRNVLENPAWYTAYTPYQPEISQGRLEALINFQTMVSELTGLPVANASLLDEATAAAEAMTVARRTAKAGGDIFFVHEDTHPQIVSVLATRAEPIGVELVVGSVDAFESLPPGDVFGLLVSFPTSTGGVVDWRPVIDRAHNDGAKVIMAVDPLASVLLASAGSLGADMAIGSAQRFGVPMGFGGPHAAFMAVRSELSRSLPGRLVGVSTDAAGRPALRLALQTREQHIRREKATSNICTAQVLLANIAGLYACWHGPDGLRRIAERVANHADRAARALRDTGLTTRHSSIFDTVCVEGVDADAVLDAAVQCGINVRRVDDDTVSFTFDETTDASVVERLLAVFGVETIGSTSPASLAMPVDLLRHDEIMQQAPFHRYRTEHEMLRYLRRLADRDLALDRTMIPLGSCTMKLNATTEMEPISWPEFADLHPYSPVDQVEGYQRVISDLEMMLAEVTGYAAVSLQPNAGSQGEFAGLLAIRAYHRSRGESDRDVCIIPSSAHGTNAASAVMAGMRVVVVGFDDRGDVDLADLANRIEEIGDRLAAIMVTYPSTHGVFERGIRRICDMVHAAGGQVYVDGANLNALVGLARPGVFGADVSHLNLHKTFCIPHGGGGPGVGPVAVSAHLAPFLPGHPLRPTERPVGPVSAAPAGSAGILPIPWVYARLMGGPGLRRATETAIVAANYLATRLQAHFPVLYTDENGRVAHECILDIRPLTKATGVTVDDIAKRLIDHGFHAPTVSFPVAGTLMIEPTESESLAELDRFVTAMTSIRAEIQRVADGEWTIEESPLRHAPHTAVDLLGDWNRAYPRDLGAFPVSGDVTDKYFPPVSRIDAAAGDRNLICTCEPLEVYAESTAQ